MAAANIRAEHRGTPTRNIGGHPPGTPPPGTPTRTGRTSGDISGTPTQNIGGHPPEEGLGDTHLYQLSETLEDTHRCGRKNTADTAEHLEVAQVGVLALDSVGALRVA